MAWLEREPSGHFHVRFRIGTRKFKRSLKTKSESAAETRRVRLEETIRLVESGRLTIPADVDVPTYLLSDGRLDQPLAVPDTVKLGRWLDSQAATRFTFSQNGDHQDDPITVDQSNHHLRHALSGSRWAKIRGWHIFRHSFISNCAACGIDQRIIDAWSGHQTDKMRRRYTHLFPDTQQDAIRLVFGQTTKTTPATGSRST